MQLYKVEILSVAYSAVCLHAYYAFQPFDYNFWCTSWCASVCATCQASKQCLLQQRLLWDRVLGVSQRLICLAVAVADNYLDSRCASEEESQGVPSSLKSCRPGTSQSSSFQQNGTRGSDCLVCFDPVWTIHIHYTTAACRVRITKWNPGCTCHIVWMIIKTWLYMLHCAVSRLKA